LICLAENTQRHATSSAAAIHCSQREEETWCFTAQQFTSEIKATAKMSEERNGLISE